MTSRPVSHVKLGDLAASAGLDRIHLLAWRDLDDPEAGGSEVHADAVATRWSDAGIDVTMRTSHADGHPPVAQRHGYRVIRRAGRYAVYPRAIASEMTGRHGPRDGLVEIWNGVPWLSPVWARGPRIVVLHHLHEKMWDLVLPNNQRLAAAGRWVERSVAPPFYRRSTIVTLSDSSKSELVELQGFDPARVRVVNPGIDPAFTAGGTRSSEPLVVSVSRLMAPKRFHLVIESMVEVRRSVPGARLVIVGKGEEHSRLERLIQDLDASEYIRLAGHVSQDDLIDLYRRAWVVTSASLAEGWGMTLTEAAACGTPAVVSDIAGHRDAVHHDRSGLLALDEPHRTQLLIDLLTDPSRRDRLAAGALERAGELTWEHTAYGVLEALAERA